jgi:hypothetical protein
MSMKEKSGSDDRIACSSSWSATSEMLTLAGSRVGQSLFGDTHIIAPPIVSSVAHRLSLGVPLVQD